LIAFPSWALYTSAIGGSVLILAVALAVFFIVRQKRKNSYETRNSLAATPADSIPKYRSSSLGASSTNSITITVINEESRDHSQSITTADHLGAETPKNYENFMTRRPSGIQYFSYS
jgi:hypothetical protein